MQRPNHLGANLTPSSGAKHMDSSRPKMNKKVSFVFCGVEPRYNVNGAKKSRWQRSSVRYLSQSHAQAEVRDIGETFDR